MDLERYHQFYTRRMLTITSRLLFVVFAGLLSVSSAPAQSTEPAYEQLALDYFANVILQNDTLLKGYSAHYDGWVDSSITTIPFKVYVKHQTDSLLSKAYGLVQTGGNEFWKKNVRPPIKLIIRLPIKAKSRRSYPIRSKVARPLVYQHLQLGDKVYVWIRVMLGAGYYGTDYYLTFDESGRILELNQESFVF